MHPPPLRPIFTSGRHLWLCIAVAGALALSTSATAARECARETPLPAEVHLIAPGAEVPEDIAWFAGIWSGEAEDERGSICTTLVVEEALTSGYAQVIFSMGTSAALHVRLPWFLRATGRVVDGELRVQLALPIPGVFPPTLTYRVAGQTLQGTHEGGDWRPGRATLTRLADESQVGCGPPTAGPLPPPSASGPRDRLTAADLLAPDSGHRPAFERRGLHQVILGPVHNAYFMPMGQAAPARHAFQGTVTVGFSHMFRARHGCTALGATMPGFTVAFFTQGEHLVPVVRGILEPPGTRMHGTLILSPGRVWSEPGDGGLSGASLPFVLIDGLAARNGLATFLYDDTRVSAWRFQIVQENVPWGDKYDGWDQAPMSYIPGPIADEEVLRAQFAAELQQQTPIRPWAELPAAVGAPGPENFDGDTAPADLRASGMIVDGVIYLRGCESRAGPYPYCRQMRHGVYSVTKSLGAAVTLLRLAQQYGDQVFDLKIKDYVTVTAAHDGWERVTFRDALNMATGIGENWPQREPNHPFADSNRSPKFFRWNKARTAQEKLDIGFSFGKYPWGPGEVVRYNDLNTFVLAAAMDSFLKRQAGPQRHLWDMMVTDVFRPLGVFQLPLRHTQEVAGERGIPLLGHGLYPTIDDLAKLTTLLQHGGQHHGQPLLSAARLAEALYRTDAKGLPSGWTGNRFGQGSYHLSFWSVPYRTATGCVFQIPHMLGAGGNIVMLLPNGLSSFRVTDGGEDSDVDTMVLAGEAIRPFPCPAESKKTPPAARQPLTASELRTELAGHTLYSDPTQMFAALGGGHLTRFAAADGVLYGIWKLEPDLDIRHDVGRWHITSDGHFCSQWHVWDSQRERCSAVYREGETFALELKDRFAKEVYRRVPGNPEGY
jgi:Beta-lactamase